MIPISDPRHAFWSFARTLVVLTVFGVAMFMQAKVPDWSEGKLICQLAAGALIAQLGHEVWKAKAARKDDR